MSRNPFSISSPPDVPGPLRATSACSPFGPSATVPGSQAANGLTVADMAASYSLSQSATPFSWSPTPQPLPFPGNHPASLPASQNSSIQPSRPDSSTVRTTGHASRGETTSTDAYERWDKKRQSDGLCAETLLVEWMADGGWRRWKDAKSTGQKDKCYINVNNHLVDKSEDISYFLC